MHKKGKEDVEQLLMGLKENVEQSQTKSVTDLMFLGL